MVDSGRHGGQRWPVVGNSSPYGKPRFRLKVLQFGERKRTGREREGKREMGKREKVRGFIP